MPEAKVLFAVASVVIFGLVAWVVMVLRTAGEPWARAPLHPVPEEGAVAEAGAATDVGDAKPATDETA